jgi:hypothetical protein
MRERFVFMKGLMRGIKWVIKMKSISFDFFFYFIYYKGINLKKSLFLYLLMDINKSFI